MLLFGLGNFWVLKPDIARACNNWGWEYYLSERLKIAEILYKCALLIKPDYPVPHYNLGLIYQKQQKFDLALVEYKIAVEGKDTEAHNNLARLKIYIHRDYTTAIDLLQKGLQLDPNAQVKSDMFKNLGWALKEQKHYSEAEIQLQEAIKLKSNRASAHCLLAQVMEAQGNNQAALAEWRNCLKYPRPKTPEVERWKNIARQRLQNHIF